MQQLLTARWRKDRARLVGWFTARRVWLLTAATVALSLTLALAGRWTLANLLALTGLAVLIAVRVPPERWQPKPWAATRVLDALVQVDVVKPPKDGGPVTLRPIGQPAHDALGTTVTFELPGAALWQDVHKAHERLARVLRVHPRQFTVSHDRKAAHAGIVTLWFGSGHLVASRPDCMQDGYRPAWRAGVVIGRDAQGRDMRLRTVGAHTALIGITGSGKTSLGRAILADALLDPDVPLLPIIDGKGDLADWQGVLAVPGVRYLPVLTADDIPKLHAFLDMIDAEAEGRRQQGRDVLPVPFVVDEWYRIRTLLEGDTAGLKRLDARMAGMLATVRSRGFSVIYMAQRCTVEYLPGALKANIGQRVVGVTATVAEVQHAIEDRPAVRPEEPGEFLVSLNAGGSSQIITSPYLDDDGWRAVIARAVELRSAQVSLSKVASDRAECKVSDPLLDAVTLALRSDGPMSATALLDWIGPDVFTGTPKALADRLRTYPELYRDRLGKSYAWHLTTLASTLATPTTTLAATPARVGGDPRSEGPAGLTDAQEA